MNKELVSQLVMLINKYVTKRNTCLRNPWQPIFSEEKELKYETLH